MARNDALWRLWYLANAENTYAIQSGWTLAITSEAGLHNNALTSKPSIGPQTGRLYKPCTPSESDINGNQETIARREFTRRVIFDFSWLQTDLCTRSRVSARQPPVAENFGNGVQDRIGDLSELVL